MRLLSPYNVEGKWPSSAGAGDQGHTRDGNLATEQLLRLGQSSFGIRLDVLSCWFGPASERTDENKEHGREVITLAHPRPRKRKLQENYVEVHWDTRVAINCDR